jgi:hypothetical protein
MRSDCLPSHPGDVVNHVEAFFEIYGLDRRGLGDNTRRLADALRAGGKYGSVPSRGMTIQDSTLAFDRALAQEIADGLLLVDDTIWFRVPGLRLELTRWSQLTVAALRHGFGADIFDPVDIFNPASATRSMLSRREPNLEIHFALSDLAGLESYGPALGYGPARRPQLVLHDEAAVPYNGRSDYLSRAMHYACQLMAAEAGEMDGDRLSDWIALRGAVDAHLADPLADIPDEAIETYRRFAPAVPLFAGGNELPALALYDAISPAPMFSLSQQRALR